MIVIYPLGSCFNNFWAVFPLRREEEEIGIPHFSSITYSVTLIESLVPILYFQTGNNNVRSLTRIIYLMLEETKLNSFRVTRRNRFYFKETI